MKSVFTRAQRFSMLLGWMLLGTVVLFVTGCGSKPAVEAKTTAPAAVTVTTATAIVREVAADFEETGSFIADESSLIAPVIPGRIVSTPVNVGAWVKQGDIVCELDPRDAQL